MKLYREFRTQEEIDEQYDLESVLDMPSYAARDIMTSQRACETLSCHLDTRYIASALTLAMGGLALGVIVGAFLKETAPRRKQLSETANVPV